MAEQAIIFDKVTGETVTTGLTDISLDGSSIVKLNIGPEQVQRFTQIGLDLYITLNSGEVITIVDFFADPGEGGRHELVLEDANGVVWWGQYSTP
ncbi:MAG TPA: BapA prefix-like domain-containing protein, partial [Pseudohongiella sp.]|nr:BapA prefix-like domain-containing protein [Pseudohongiella sp.]